MKIRIILVVLFFYGFAACSKKEKAPLSASKSSTLLDESKNATVTRDSSTSFVDSSKTATLKYSWEILDNTKGLSNSSVNTIFQDSENLLWIGTWDGLNRYDGNNFKIFRPDPNTKNGLSNQVILKIDEDDQGQIWILTMHGINKYNKKTNTFYPYYFSRKNKPPLTESEFNMALNASKKVFCAVKDWGIGYFDGNDFKLLKTAPHLKKTVKKIDFTSNGELLVLFEDNTLYCLTIQRHKDGSFSIFKDTLISDKIKSYALVSDQKLWTLSLSGSSSLYELETYKNRILSIKDIHDVIGKIPEGLVVAGKSGHYIINSNGEVVSRNWLKYLNNQKASTLLRGNENILWVGTDGDGIVKIYPSNKPFNLVSKAQVAELDGAIVRTFLKVDKNVFLVGTKGKGLFQFSSDFYDNPEKPLEYKVYNENNSAINNSIFSLFKGQDELVYIGTDGEGLSIYDLKKSKLINWSSISGSSNADYFKSVYSIYQDDDGFIWLGTNGYGMIRFKIERSNEKLILTNFKKYIAVNTENALSSNIVFSIIPKNQNEIWIGTRLGGLHLFNKKTERFITYKNNPYDDTSLSNNDILCLQTDAKNRLWIGTSLGLNVLKRIDTKGKAEFKRYTVTDGLPNNTIHGIIADTKNNLWLSTNLGLSNFNVNDQRFSNYTRNEGLQNNEFADGAFYKDPDSDFLFMGGIKGFNYFLPQMIKESTVIPDLFIDKISGQNQPDPYYQGLVITPKLIAKPAIVLKHNQNFFDIELTALTYLNTEKCQYAYQLKNFDKGWNTINNRRIISFTNVPDGNYSLWIKWSNSDGVWSKPVHAIDIKIKPVFWQSNLAIVAYILLLLAFVLFVLSYYKKRQSLTQNILFRQREKELHENRLTFFTEIAHEFQTPLTLIIGPVQKLAETTDLNENNKKFIQMIQRNSSRLLFLTQQLLEFRKAEYDYLEVSVKKFDLVGLVEQIAELFDEWAIEKNIEYKLNVPTVLRGWFDKDKIEKIVFNLMSNAFKYSPVNGKINISFSLHDKNTLNITVTNTGKGIPKEKLDSLFTQFFLGESTENSDNNMFRTGIGLAYVKKLVTVLSGEIQVSSTPNQSTTFTILLPCNKKAFSKKELDTASAPILISHHLKDILDENATKTDVKPQKIVTLENLNDNRKIILVVEDEKDIHVLLHSLLSEKYKLIIAYNGLEALEIIDQTIPDIIISDVMMPLMDGVELCAKIKTNLKTCHIPFIMLTAKDSVIHRIEGIESGANSYIPKPFNLDHLLVRIQKLLEEKELISQYFRQYTLEENFSDLPIDHEAKDFIKKVIELIRANIDNENLQSLFIEKELGISNSQLYRKVKELFGFSPGDLIRTIRLKHAAELLRRNKLTVSEVCYKSGFNNRSYFYREFKKLYNLTPKNYQLKYSLKVVG